MSFAVHDRVIEYIHVYMDTTKKIILHSGSGKVRTCAVDNKFSYDFDDQYDMIQKLHDQLYNTIGGEYDPPLQTVVQQLHKKIAGYKAQDVAKGLYDCDKIVHLADVVKQLWDAKMTCFYCKKHVYVLYEIVREVQQWTLDRIDNSLGHNRDNVMIACLECNLRRRTMYHERFAFTKTFTKVTKLDS